MEGERNREETEAKWTRKRIGEAVRVKYREGWVRFYELNGVAAAAVKGWRQKTCCATLSRAPFPHTAVPSTRAPLNTRRPRSRRYPSPFTLPFATFPPPPPVTTVANPSRSSISVPPATHPYRQLRQADLVSGGPRPPPHIHHVHINDAATHYFT